MQSSLASWAASAATCAPATSENPSPNADSFAARSLLADCRTPAHRALSGGVIEIHLSAAPCIAALVDRLDQHCHLVEIDAESWRHKEANTRSRKKPEST